MYAMILGWMLAAVATAPASDGVAQCKQGCASAESQTDRTTCELQCEQGGGSGAKVIRFQQTRELGGSPQGGKNAGGTTTTVTTQDQHGATTTTTHGHTHGDVAAPTTATAAAATKAGRTTTPATATPAPGPSAATPAASATAATLGRAKSYAALASCQRTCNVQTAPSPRASCKLKCLRTPATAAPQRGDGRPFGASFGPPPPTPTQ